jgi:hypothetical protein
MAQARGRDSHAGGVMLDYSIRGPLAPSISSEFYGWTGRGGTSSTPKQYQHTIKSEITLVVLHH